MRRILFAIFIAVPGCKKQVAAPTVDAAVPVAPLADARPAPADARPPDARSPDARPVDAPPPPEDAGSDEPDAEITRREILFEKEVHGTLVVPNLKPLEGATVRLECSREIRAGSEGGPQRTQCDSVLTVEKDGKVIARNDESVFGIDFEPAGGNNGSLDLELLVLEPDTGASLIVVRSASQEGDEHMKATTDLELFALNVDELRVVLNHTIYRLDDHGPDGSGMREETETTVEPGKRRTNGMRNLIATERNARTGRTLGVVTFVWNFGEYLDKKTLAPLPDAGVK